MATRWDDTTRRWLVDDEPRMGPGEWFAVRLESRDGGRVLDAYAQVHGVTFCDRRIAGFEGDEPFAMFAMFAMRSPRAGR